MEYISDPEGTGKQANLFFGWYECLGQSGAASRIDCLLLCLGIFQLLSEGQSEKSVVLGEWWKEGYEFAQGREEECLTCWAHRICSINVYCVELH